MPQNTIQRQPRLSRRDYILVSGCILISICALVGTLMPGFGMVVADMPWWFAFGLAVLIYVVTFFTLRSSPRPRSQKLADEWSKENPELMQRLNEVMAQATKDPDGIGYFAHALNLIQKDPERAALLEGLYYRTGNKTQLQVALCRREWDGMLKTVRRG